MIDFPASPTENQMFQAPGGPRYVYSNGGWRMSDPGPPGTAQTRNRIVNGAMQISQELGNTASSTPAAYIVDQWSLSPATTGTITGQRVQSVTPNGSRDRLRLTVTVADASLAAGEFLRYIQPIEGVRTADFQWGSAAAKQAVLRFGWKSPAGTYSAYIVNGAGARSYVMQFTVAAGQANTDTVQTFIIPGDTTGVWPTDTSKGMMLCLVMAAGTTFQGVVGWQAGEIMGTSANTNGMATAGAVYELFDVGLYLDPLATGVAPPWVMPDEADELIACMRYWQMTPATLALVLGSGAYVGGVTHWFTGYLPVAMRIDPAVATGTITYANASGFSMLSSNRAYRGATTSTAAGNFTASLMPSYNARM